MARMIDADALLALVKENAPMIYHMLACVIALAPTIDAEPVRHEHWIHCAGKSNLWYCSGCGGKIIYNPTRRTYIVEKRPVHEVNKWCRNCGARMDGGAEREQS